MKVFPIIGLAAILISCSQPTQWRPLTIGCPDGPFCFGEASMMSRIETRPTVLKTEAITEKTKQGTGKWKKETSMRNRKKTYHTTIRGKTRVPPRKKNMPAKIGRKDQSVTSAPRPTNSANGVNQTAPPSTSQRHAVVATAKSKFAYKTKRPAQAEIGRKDNSVSEISKSLVEADQEKQASSPSIDQPDYVRTKAKAKTAGKLDKPVSTEINNANNSSKEIEKSLMGVDQERQGFPASNFQVASIIAKAKTKGAVKPDKSASGNIVNKDNSVMKIAKSSMGAGVEKQASVTLGVEPELIITKARLKVLAILEKPGSAEFIEIKRVKKDTLGQSIDTVCGRLRQKNASGENLGERSFIYFVQDDDAYLIDSHNTTVAAAYRNICN
jgi:hypothetical protein